MMPIHQQLWSLECSVIETVVSLLSNVMEHRLAGIQSHCPDNVYDIQPVRKSSTDQCNSSGQTSVFCGLMKKILILFQETVLFLINWWWWNWWWNFDAHHQLFREMGSWMVQPLWWNVMFLINWFYECAFLILYFSVMCWVMSLVW